MTIAAHIVSTDHHYLSDSLRSLAASHPDDHFIIFSDENLSAQFSGAKNITPVVVQPPVRNSISLYYWYNLKLPALIKRYDAAAFISDAAVLSSKLKVAQYLFLEDLLFLRSRQHPYKRFIQKYFHRFVERSTAIFTTEKYIADSISNKYPAAAKKNLTVYHGLPNDFKPISWEEKEKVTEEFTSGRDYFIFYVSGNTRLHIKMALKAFSIFKKWQKSSMQMLMLLDKVSPENVTAEIGTYKFRAEVKLVSMENVPQTARLLAAAYALVYLPKMAAGETVPLHSLQCEVPVITHLSDELKMSFGNAALYAGLNEASVAEKMQLLYKDEALKKSVVAAGSGLLRPYDAAKAAADLWASIRLQSGS